MKIVNERPPEWIMQGCLNQFRIDVDNTFWTYGDTIYHPGGGVIPADIMAHEERHGLQQSAYERWECEGCHAPFAEYINGCPHCWDDSLSREENVAKYPNRGVKLVGQGKDGWWQRYLVDPRFRLEQEADAYGVQYAFHCSLSKDRERRALALFQLSRQLSGPLYQLAVTGEQARKMIKVLAGQDRL